ncbi:MAG: MFS transporter [Hyphomicrobiales bacterium]|nr:MFS transporter [Hyphomicrobiales bacterium]
MCAALTLALAGSFAFPALLPGLVAAWGLSNTDAGWIAGVYFAGYAAAVAVLVTLTDRVDARRVFLGGALATALAMAGFAWLAQGFWSALLFRLLAGAGLAGTYMPGLRALIDRYDGPGQGRALSFYTATFSLGMALSFLLAGEVGARLGWRAAFWAAAGASALALPLVALALRPAAPAADPDVASLFDLRPVLRNRPAMGYVLAYAVHAWELMGMRSWLVAFLAFVLALDGGGASWPAPTTVATIGGVLATAASIGGQEAAARWGRRRVLAVLMGASAVTSMAMGFSALASYAVAAAAALVYMLVTLADSAALTAGTVAMAAPGRRGATLAVHSLIGFAGGALGPVVMGAVLDAAGGGASVTAWVLGFGSLGLAVALGPVFLYLLGGRRAPTGSS